jgi:alkylation response protein AidB-like acyl-CoA dehydrogenase
MNIEIKKLARTTITQQLMNDLVALAQRRSKNGGKATRDPAVRQRMADVLIRTESMKYHALKQLSDEIHGRPPGIGASINKLVTTELNHDICAVALEVLGSYGQLRRNAPHVEDKGAWPKDHMFTLGLIIGGGTSQIQKNIISERGLGLPKGA